MNVDRIFVDGGTRAPSGDTGCHVLGNRRALLVDPAARHERIDERIEDVAHVVVTHHHGDHVGAVAHYANVSDATVWCRYGREDDFVRATGVEPDRRFREGTTISTDGGPIVVRDTPGHAPEHVAFATDDALVVGDLAVEEGSVVVGAPHGDMRSYISSLRRVWATNPERLLPAHGPIIEDPRSTCERLIRHRLEREARVLTAVEAGAMDVDSILDGAYDKDLTGVRDLAKATIHAHLDKLAHEGRIDWNGSRATSS